MGGARASSGVVVPEMPTRLATLVTGGAGDEDHENGESAEYSISKHPRPSAPVRQGRCEVTPYEPAYADFDRSAAYGALSRGESDSINAAFECCDRWCGAGRIALYAAAADGRREAYSFEDLRHLSSRLARLFDSLGISPGDRIAGLLPRTPMLLATILAVWRVGAVYQPLFTAFGPKAIEHRLTTAGAKLVVTDPVNRGKLNGIELSARILVTEHGAESYPGDIDLAAALDKGDELYEPVERRLDDPFLVMFTSGTTGLPKSLTVPLRAIPAFIGYMREAIDLRPEDAFWNIADPGWAYGLYYAVVGPLAMGHATLFYDGGFNAEAAVEIVREYGISNLAGSPTAYRLLIAAGPEAIAPIAGHLRVVSSAGEALNPEVVRWFAEYLRAPIYDHYGQTELGMVVCNHHALDHPVTAGSAGFAVPGHRVVVLDDDNNELGTHAPGVLAIDIPQSPLFWFNGYEQTAEKGLGRYYRSGDIVERNADGSISFVGRADDLITSSGYRIGPFDVESALVEHSAVVEAAVIGKPDPQRTEIVKAFVILRRGEVASETLSKALQEHVKSRLSAHAYPREIEFVEELPKTPSGKIQRFLLRARERERVERGG